MKIVINGKTAEVPGGSSQEIYFTEETQIGTWFGKPLYRKVITGLTLPTEANTDSVYDITSLGIDDICSYNIVARRGEDKWYTQIPFRTHRVSDSAWHMFIAYVSSDTIKFSNACSSETVGTSWYGASCRIILEYTKTTDIATNAISEPTAAFAYEALDDYPAVASTAPAAATEGLETGDIHESEEV